jgi:hypothetical protein
MLAAVAAERDQLKFELELTKQSPAETLAARCASFAQRCWLFQSEIRHRNTLHRALVI